jgi:ABC-2 type transport system permease protein
MTSALHSEVLRLLTLRSTSVYAVLLIGSCFGPIILMTLLYDIEYQGPIDAGDLGRCVSIFHMVAVIFAGASTASEITTGAVGISVLTQRRRWTSLAAAAVVKSAFLVLTFTSGMALAIAAAQFYPDGITISPRGWAYLVAYLAVVLLWANVSLSLAVLTRSVAAAIAVPLVWMLLLEQLMSMVPMLAPAIHWMPFTAGMDLLGTILGESSAPHGPWAAIAVLSILGLAVTATASATHIARDVPE